VGAAGHVRRQRRLPLVSVVRETMVLAFENRDGAGRMPACDVTVHVKTIAAPRFAG